MPNSISTEKNDHCRSCATIWEERDPRPAGAPPHRPFPSSACRLDCLRPFAGSERQSSRNRRPRRQRYPPCLSAGFRVSGAHERGVRYTHPRRGGGRDDVRGPCRAGARWSWTMPAPRARRSASPAAGAAISPTCTRPENFLSRNPHFCKSALARYTQWDFIDLVERHGIAWHEKTLGQLFCDGGPRRSSTCCGRDGPRGGRSVALDAADRPRA